MKAKLVELWPCENRGPYEAYGFKTKSAAKRFMKSLGFRDREIDGTGTDAESHGYNNGKLPFGRFFPATYVEGYKYIAHIRRE